MSEITLDDVEDAVRQHEDPVVTARELSDELDCSARHALDQLRLLERDGAVESKTIGARAVAWYHVDRVTPPILPADEHPDQRGLDELDADDRAVVERITEGADRVLDDVVDGTPLREDDRDGRDERRCPERTLLGADADPIDDVLARFRPGRSAGERREQRRDAARAALKWLRARDEPATGAEFRDALLPDHAVDDQSPETFWRKTIRPALQLAIEDDVVEFIDGRHEYRWIGETGE